MTNLTLLFSTYNGARTLPGFLDGLEALDCPPGGWKIVAVDNGSRDGSAELLSERAGRLPLTVVSEPRRGKSAGLNAGLGHIEGDLVVLTDDDVVPPRDWLVALRGLAERLGDYDIFGGAIYPIWPHPPPEWVLRLAYKEYFAWTAFPEGPVGPTAIWGPNMAVRREVLSGRRFRDGIGPNGRAAYPVGAETELLIRAATAGHLCWHAPAIAVGHVVEPHQLTTRWLLQRAHNHARGIRRMLPDEGPPPGPALLLGLPPKLVFQYLCALSKAARASVAPLPPRNCISGAS